MIAILDTNVLIAALVTDGTCSKLLLRARRKDFFLVISPFILSEVQRVLSKKFRASKEEIASAINLIHEASHRVIKQNVKIERTCRDPDNDEVPACAQAAEADYLVTGDHDLLIIKKMLFQRWVRSIKEECLSKVILFGESSLRRTIIEYVEHYHRETDHQGKDNVLLFPSPGRNRNEAGPIWCREGVGGLLKY